MFPYKIERGRSGKTTILFSYISLFSPLYVQHVVWFQFLALARFWWMFFSSQNMRTLRTWNNGAQNTGKKFQRQELSRKSKKLVCSTVNWCATSISIQRWNHQRGRLQSNAGQLYPVRSSAIYTWCYFPAVWRSHSESTCWSLFIGWEVSNSLDWKLMPNRLTNIITWLSLNTFVLRRFKMHVVFCTSLSCIMQLKLRITTAIRVDSRWILTIVCKAAKNRFVCPYSRVRRIYKTPMTFKKLL